MSPSGAEVIRQIKQQVQEVDPAEVSEHLGNGIDPHRRARVARSGTAGTSRAPCTSRAAISSRASRARSPTATRRVVLYCASGQRSALAAHTLTELLGFTERALDDRRHHAVEGPRLQGRGPEGAHGRAEGALRPPPPAPRGRRRGPGQAARRQGAAARRRRARRADRALPRRRRRGHARHRRRRRGRPLQPAAPGDPLDQDRSARRRSTPPRRRSTRSTRTSTSSSTPCAWTPRTSWRSSRATT